MRKIISSHRHGGRLGGGLAITRAIKDWRRSPVTEGILFGALIALILFAPIGGH